MHSASQRSSDLVIFGAWLPASYFGYRYTLSGTREVVRIKDARLAESGWRLLADIRSDGRGLVRSFLICQKEITNSSRYFGAHSSLTFSPFPANIRAVKCPNARAIEFEQEYRLLPLTKDKVPARRMQEIAKKSIHESCSSLRGSRYIFIHGPQQNRNRGAYGCIGFSDKTANQLTLLVIPHREAYAVRYEFIRQSSRQ